MIRSVVYLVKFPDLAFSLPSIKSFFLPVILTLFYLLSVYITALYMLYGVIFAKFKAYLNNDLLGFAKRTALKSCGLSIRKLNRVAGQVGELYSGSSKDDINKVFH